MPGTSSLNQFLEGFQIFEETPCPWLVGIFTAKRTMFLGFSQIVTETLPALQELKKEGLVRAVGITGPAAGHLPLRPRQANLSCRYRCRHAARQCYLLGTCVVS